MGLLFQEGLSGGLRLEDARLPLPSQFLADFAPLSNQADKTFRKMSVEVIGDEDPFAVGIGVEQPLDMSRKLVFGSGRLDRGSDDLASSDFKVGGQAEGAMADILELPALDLAGLHSLEGSFGFERLDPGLFVDANHMDTFFMESRRRVVNVAHPLHFRLKGNGILDLRFEPMSALVGLEVGLPLKNALHSSQRFGLQSSV